MTTWQPTDLTRLGAADEVTVSTVRSGGSRRAGVPIWIVRIGDELYVRSYRGSAGSWYRHAQTEGGGRVTAAGSDYPVHFQAATDHDLQARVDAAYQSKYGRYGGSYVSQMTGSAAQNTTLRLEPAN